MGLLKTIVTTTAIKSAERVATKIIERPRREKPQREKPQYVIIPKDSEAFRGDDYDSVLHELSSYGFESIALVEERDLINGFLTPYGSVESVVVNGKELKARKKYLPTDKVVVYYHTFINRNKNPKK